MFVLAIPGAVTAKYMRLFSVSSEDEAVQLYSLYSTRVAPVATVCRALSSATSKLQVWLYMTCISVDKTFVQCSAVCLIRLFINIYLSLLQCSPLNPGSVNSEILLTQIGDCGPC